MKTPDCDTADRAAVLIDGPIRRMLHEKCAGFYRTPTGETRLCECGCHGDIPLEARVEARGDEAVFILEEPTAPDGTYPTTQDRKRGRKRPRATGKCEHCGAPTGGRFAVGHDAKLKSELTAAASRGDAEAIAELILRDWKRLTKVDADATTMDHGLALARGEGYALVERRNAIRQSRA